MGSQEPVLGEETAPGADVFGQPEEPVDDGLDEEERERLRVAEEEQA